MNLVYAQTGMVWTEQDWGESENWEVRETKRSLAMEDCVGHEMELEFYFNCYMKPLTWYNVIYASFKNSNTESEVYIIPPMICSHLQK